MRALLALLALLALTARPAAALEGPRCRPHTNCSYENESVSNKEFFFKVHGKQLNIVYDESLKILSLRCNQGSKFETGPALAADDPALPALPALAEVATVIFEGCRVPNVSYATALLALNVRVTKCLNLSEQPHEPLLTRHHFVGLRVSQFELRGEARADQPLRPAPDFLEELPNLKQLWLYRVKAPQALLGLPVTLESLILNEVALVAAERELQASPDPALRDSATRWLGRLQALQKLSIIEQATDEALGTEARLTPPPLAALPHLTDAMIYAPLGPLPKHWLNGSKLHGLNIGSSDISDLSNLPFEGANLTTLNLSNNNLTDFPKDVFRTLRGLETLDVSGNGLSRAALERALPPLVALRTLRANRCRRLGSLCGTSSIVAGRELSQLPRTLRTLLLSGTGATRVCSDWLSAPELLTIDLSKNQIDSLDYDDLVMMRSTDGSVQLKLDNNPLRAVLVSAEQLASCRANASAPAPRDPAETRRARVELSLSTLNCNCNNARLRALLQSECPTLLALEGRAACAPDPLLGDRPKGFLNYDPDDLLCQYEGSCVPGCNCGAWRLSDNATVVRCSGVLAAPRWPAASATRPLVLRAPAAGLRAVPRATLAELRAPNNRITALHDTDIPDTLRVLDLRNNNITLVTAEAAVRLQRRRVNVSLAGNPFACGCAEQEALARLRDANVSDWLELRCGDDGPLSGRALSHLQPDELCWSPLPLLALGGVALLAAAVAGWLLWRRGKPHLKQFLFQHQLCLDWVLGADDTVDDPTKTHDAFVSYAHQDHAKAASVVRGLEQRGYSTVEHCRDWMPGAAVAEHIARSVLCARRTLLLVSDDYGASKWALEEFRAAHSHALERRSARVLLVRCGLRAPERLPVDLQLHLRLNTYLDYDDAAFWDKLCRVMPPLPAGPSPKAEEPSLAARLVSATQSLKPHLLWTPPAPRAAPLAEDPPRSLTPPLPRATQADAKLRQQLNSTAPLAAQAEAADKLRQLLTPPKPQPAPTPAPAPAPRTATLAGAPLHPLTPPPPRAAQPDADAKLRQHLTPPTPRAAPAPVPAPAPTPAPAPIHKQTFTAQMALEPRAATAAPSAC